MDDEIEVLIRVYAGFNARDIDAVLGAFTDDVEWANGMEGGHVHGHDAVRAYWTRQWTIIDPRVEPLAFHLRPDGRILVEVRQIIRDLQGQRLPGQTEDPTIGHVFRLRDGKVARFDIEASAQPRGRCGALPARRGRPGPRGPAAGEGLPPPQLSHLAALAPETRPGIIPP